MGLSAGNPYVLGVRPKMTDLDLHPTTLILYKDPHQWPTGGADHTPMWIALGPPAVTDALHHGDGRS